MSGPRSGPRTMSQVIAKRDLRYVLLSFSLSLSRQTSTSAQRSTANDFLSTKTIVACPTLLRGARRPGFLLSPFARSLALCYTLFPALNIV